MRSVELFAGAGGLGMGLGAAGFAPDLVVEWDANSCRTLRDNKMRGVPHVAEWNIVEGDARGIDFTTIRGGVDLVSGGPPCQPFSIGGKHQGQSDHRNMWPEAVRAVRELAPRAFVFENVRGLMRPVFAPYLHYIEMQLRIPELVPGVDEPWQHHAARLKQELHDNSLRGQGLAYRVSVHAVDAADYGTAQKRRRIIIVGFREDVPVDWIAPEPTHSRAALLWDQWVSGDYFERHGLTQRTRPVMPESFQSAIDRLQNSTRPASHAWRTVRDVIGDLPTPAKTRVTIANHRFQPGARAYPGHTGSRFDEPAKALKAGDHGVPGGENMLAHPNGAVRYFSVREAARLQGFPDAFIFPETVSWTESMRQLGNAVPTPLATIFGTAIARALPPLVEQCRQRRTAA